MTATETPVLLEVEPSPVKVINNFVRIVDFEGCRSVFICDQLFYHYVLGNRDEEAFIIGVLARGGHAGQRALARAFGVDEKTVYRYRRRVEEDGAAGIPQRKRGPKGPSVATASFRKRVIALKDEEHTAAWVGRTLGVSHTTINRILREEGYALSGGPTLVDLEEEAAASTAEGEAGQEVVAEVPEPAASRAEETESAVLTEEKPAQEAPAAVELSEDGRDEAAVETPTLESAETVLGAMGRPVVEAVAPRIIERLLARTGEMEEAPPIIEPGMNLRWAGAFLALPGLLEVGLLSAALSVYQRLKNGFYGLRSTILTLFLMAVMRVKSPEGLSGLPPEILGRILGLDRSPEVKTVRRKLRELSCRCLAADFLTELAKNIRKENEHLLGFLYVDGHVRAYYGKKKLPKTWVATRRLCLPATTDIWVNDAAGDPFFFVTTEGNPALSKALPRVLANVRQILGEGRRAVVIFDRGGWSAKAMKKLVAMGFDFITYRRRPYENLREDLFEEVEIEPRKSILLAESKIMVKGLGRVRVVAKQDPDGTQVHILTNLTPDQLSKEEAYIRISRRWRQENFFKYGRAHYAIDHLVSFDSASVDGEREIPNPAWKAQDRVVRAKRKQVRQLTELLGESSKEEESRGRPTMRGFKSAIFEVGLPLAKAEKELEDALATRRAVPKRIKLKDLGGEPEVRLEFERKILTDAVKLAAYRVESGLANLITMHYSRSREEGRKLIQEAMRAQGDIEVTPSMIKITLEPLSSAHRTSALMKLCDILNEKDALYPGSKLRLRYGVREAASRAE